MAKIIGDLSEELELAKHAAKEVGKIQMEYFRKPLRVVRKSIKEFVSEVDMKSQNLANQLLSERFDYSVASEELKQTELSDGDYFWIVDPLDGTHNFIAGLPNFGVSIGLASKRDFVLGVIYVPYLEELLYAIKGGGAFMNGNKIHVSSNPDLEKSMVTYDNQFHLDPDSFDRFKRISGNCFTARVLGSAIYDFSLVASGRIDSRIWNCTKMFDFVAGTVIVKEAGGKVTDFNNQEITLESKKVVASNGLVHNRILEILNKEG